MKVAIYSRFLEIELLPDVQLLMNELAAQQIEPILFEPLYRQLENNILLPPKFGIFLLPEELNEDFECVISLGGDGTLLDTVTMVQDKNIPVLGINFGRLGFLAGLGKENLSTAVNALINRTYVLDKRVLMHLDSDIPLFEGKPYALNEFSIHKRDIASMIKIHTYLNGEFLNTYWADGLIVATPTGSTGYSLSCNGPVLFPDCGSFVITPVAPHNLNVRPIIVPDNHIISFEVESRSDQIIVAMDSRREIVDKQIQLAVKKEQFTLSLIRLHENNFLQTIRNKLSWGLDKRN